MSSRLHLLLATLLAGALFLPATPAPASSKRISKDIAEVNDLLLNPGKGWWVFGGDMIDWTYQVHITDRTTAQPRDAAAAIMEAAAGTDEWFVGGPDVNPIKYPDYHSVVGLGYARFEWAELEPARGFYNWTPIENVLKPFADSGKQFAFGVMPADSLSTNPYVTPKWVFDAGAQQVDVTGTDGITRHLPNWTDPVFLACQKEFLEALAKQYDGDPRIAFIDMRSYGNWGEQHLFGFEGGNAYRLANSITADQLRDLYIKPFREAFKKTLIVNVWGGPDYADTYRWGVEQGISLRRDGLLLKHLDGSWQSDGTETSLAAGKLPTVFEFGEDYTSMLNDGLWDTEALEQHVNNGQPSWMWLYYNMYRDNKAWCDWMGNRLGYWLRIAHVEYDAELSAGTPLTVAMSFKNDGVAPNFRPATCYLALLNQVGRVVKKQATSWDSFAWKPEKTKVESATVATDGLSAGAYTLAFGMSTEDDGTPDYLFGSEGKNEDGWYELGSIVVTQATATPETATSSETAASPTTVASPATPASPATALTPSSPTTSGSPASQSIPESPASPSTAESPHSPSAPATSTAPASPSTPTAPPGSSLPRWNWNSSAGWSYLLEDGSAARGWREIDGAWYYFDGIGRLASGWLLNSGNWFYLNERHDGSFGQMAVGWHGDEATGFWYWLEPSNSRGPRGALARNTWILDRGDWYRIGPGGFALTGWQFFDGSWRYLDDQGRMLANARTPDGYYVDAAGRWLA